MVSYEQFRLHTTVVLFQILNNIKKHVACVFNGVIYNNLNLTKKTPSLSDEPEKFTK